MNITIDIILIIQLFKSRLIVFKKAAIYKNSGT